MQVALWILIGLMVFVGILQLYQWIEINTAKRDMMRAFADARRVTSKPPTGARKPRA